MHEQLLARSSDPAQRAIAGAAERIASFRYVGQGHITAADAFLAASAAARAREQRRIAWEERCLSRAEDLKAEWSARVDVGRQGVGSVKGGEVGE